MSMQCHDNMLVLYALTKRKSLPNIAGVPAVGDKVVLNPMVNSSSMTYSIVVSIHVENDRYIIIHDHLSPKWCMCV
jgi:hypothetical protein